MDTEQNHKEAEVLARLAGISVPQERLPLLTSGLMVRRSGVEQLSKHELGQTEPASRFRPPQR